MNQVYMVYVTCPTVEEATTLAREVVTERLAACVNILPQITSIYHWNGTMNQETEVLLLVKTTNHVLPSLIERIQQLHSYMIPEIIAAPIVDGSERYLHWVRSEVLAQRDEE